MFGTRCDGHTVPRTVDNLPLAPCRGQQPWHHQACRDSLQHLEGIDSVLVLLLARLLPLLFARLLLDFLLIHCLICSELIIELPAFCYLLLLNRTPSRSFGNLVRQQAAMSDPTFDVAVGVKLLTRRPRNYSNLSRLWCPDRGLCLAATSCRHGKRGQDLHSGIGVRLCFGNICGCSHFLRPISFFCLGGSSW